MIARHPTSRKNTDIQCAMNLPYSTIFFTIKRSKTSTAGGHGSTAQCKADS